MEIKLLLSIEQKYEVEKLVIPNARCVDLPKLRRKMCGFFKLFYYFISNIKCDCNIQTKYKLIDVIKMSNKLQENNNKIL